MLPLHHTEIGLTGGIRTPDQRIRNPLLYPLSYGQKLLNSVLFKTIKFIKTTIGMKFS